MHFVGRSADSVFDLLSGALSATSRPDRVRLLPFSCRFEDPLRPHEVRRIRTALARFMAWEPSFAEPWLRSLTLELRHGPSPRRPAVRRGARGTQ